MTFLATPSPADVVGAAPLLEVVGRDLTVPLVTGGTRRFVQLDYAASAPPLQAVADAVEEFLPWYSSVHRGAGFTSTVSSEALESARDSVRAFVGGRAGDAVVFTRNTTDSLNLLSRALPHETCVITLDLEHHANLLPWRDRDHVHLTTPCSAAELPGLFDEALRRVGGARGFVAITGASNVTGELLPIGEIAAIVHGHGARLVVDAAQLAPHRPVDIAALDIDYVAFSGHKFYAPYGAGVLVGRPDWLDSAPPHLAGGGAVRRVTQTAVEWSASPARHEAGTPNVVGAVAIAAACRALTALGMDRIAAHDSALTDHLRDELTGIDDVEVLSAFGGDSERVGIVALRTVGTPAAVVAAALSAEHGIATRDGAFCAHPFLRNLGGAADDHDLPNALRVSIGVGTTRADIDMFVDALADITTNGPRWAYAFTAGRLAPSPDDRPRPTFV